MDFNEIIREGIDTSIQFVLTVAYLAGKTGESLDEAKEKCTTYLKEALHSHGVVIKVDRELPTDVIEKNLISLELGETSRAWVLSNLKYQVKKAGYEAVELFVI